MHKVIEAAIHKLVKDGLIDVGLEEWGVYVVEARFMPVFFIIILTVASSAFVGIIHSLSFMIPFVYFRKLSGGYHCKTIERCLTLSVVVVVLGCVLSESIQRFPQLIFLLIFMSIVFFCVAEITGKSAYTGKRTESRAKLHMRIAIFCVIAVVCFSLGTGKNTIASYVTSSFAIAGLSLVCRTDKGEK